MDNNMINETVDAVVEKAPEIIEQNQEVIDAYVLTPVRAFALGIVGGVCGGISALAGGFLAKKAKNGVASLKDKMKARKEKKESDKKKTEAAEKNDVEHDDHDDDYTEE